MALAPPPHLLQTVNQIAGQLNSDECKTTAYLCGSPGADTSAADVKEMLRAQLVGGQIDDLFLVELLSELGRFDILRRSFGTSKGQVERALGSRHVLSKYRVLMASINVNLSSEDLRTIKFLLSHTLPQEKLDKAKTFLDVVVELEKLDEVSAERLDFVGQCLRNIGRIDLAKKVHSYQQSVGAPQLQPVAPRQISQQQTHANPVSQMHATPFSSPTPSHFGPRYQANQRQPCIPPGDMAVPVPRQQHCQRSLDEYKLRSDPRGLCLIIDCVGIDGEMLEQTFTALHFKVVLHKWLNVNDTCSFLRETSKWRQHQEADAFVCCIISRGNATDLLATDSHRAGLSLEVIRHLFAADACPMLAGKPKLFFIQRYSVQEPMPHADWNGELETDGIGAKSRLETVPVDADVFWSHCWTNEAQLERGDHRSAYLQALTDALHRGQRRKTHLVDIHTEVNGAVYDHNKRNPGATFYIDLKHTLRKNLYLS